MPYFIHHGHRLFYREQGSGPLLLILPGNTASSVCYEGEIEYFSRHYHVIALDLWGTGQSARTLLWPDNWWELGARDATWLVQQVSEQDAYVMGSSGGAIVALLMAILFPTHVRAVIADSCLRQYPAEQIQQVIDERRQRTAHQSEFWKFAHGDDWEQVVEADSDLLMRLARRGTLDWTQGRLKEIRCPVLFTASLKDKVLPNVGQQMCAMAEQIPNSQVFFVSSGDHPMMWSRRKEFLRVSEHFLKSLHS